LAYIHKLFKCIKIKYIMFGEKCPKCNARVKKNYDFCPHCGLNIISEDFDDYGFLGKKDIQDFNDMGIKLPFGFNALMKPLMKELVKQMDALDKELVNEKKSIRPHTNMPLKTTLFSVHIGMPGQKPIKIMSSNSPRMMMESSSKNMKPKILKLPKIADTDFQKIKKLIKKEPETEVRRLADRIIYEIKLPEVNSLKNIDINPLEGAIEIKAFSDKELFIKKIEMDLQLINYSFANETLVLELLAK